MRRFRMQERAGKAKRLASKDMEPRRVVVVSGSFAHRVLFVGVRGSQPACRPSWGRLDGRLARDDIHQGE
jgi:hypothetical protein